MSAPQERYLQWELTKTSLSRGPCKYSRDPTRLSLANTPIITQQTDLLVRANEYDVDDLFSAVRRHVWLNIEHCKTTETTEGLIELIRKVYDEELPLTLHQFRLYAVQKLFSRETDKGFDDCRENLEQEIPEFATDYTRELRERLSAAREALRNQGYELVLDSGRRRGAPASGSTQDRLHYSTPRSLITIQDIEALWMGIEPSWGRPGRIPKHCNESQL